MLAVYDVIGRGTLRGKCPVQPRQGGRGFGVVIAQPLIQLRAERVPEALRFRGARGSARRHLRGGIRQPLVGQGIRPFAQLQPRDDAGREPRQVFDQHHAQGDGDRPEFADLERLNPLVGAAEAVQRIELEAAVRMRDNGPSQSVDPRIAAQRSMRKLRQLLVKSRRQIAPHGTDVLVDDVVIVDQPFGRRRHRTALADSGYERAKGRFEGERIGA